MSLCQRSGWYEETFKSHSECCFKYYLMLWSSLYLSVSCKKESVIKMILCTNMISVCLNYAWTAQQNTLSCVCVSPFCWSVIIYQWLQVCCISSYSTQTCHVTAEMLQCWFVTMEFLVQAWVRLWTAVINLVQATVIFIFSVMIFICFSWMLYKILFTDDSNHYNLFHNSRQFLGYEYFYRDIKSENSLS